MIQYASNFIASQSSCSSKMSHPFFLQKAYVDLKQLN